MAPSHDFLRTMEFNLAPIMPSRIIAIVFCVTISVIIVSVFAFFFLCCYCRYSCRSLRRRKSTSTAPPPEETPMSQPNDEVLHRIITLRQWAYPPNPRGPNLGETRDAGNLV
ncbi:uncharacterized protein EI97DRAFT_462304 [Westerdykella ornata]|uniref:Uncharacterized protein n=1 Tax=Westerdykella ornata TaxID=318751 RepID=A0A6A6J740_WESOR|nr:uncharacterized protein EI97DRAFT_462304 [Westerdykella ornata]KAF2272007.1 hypothetical protein EI97DRAFT_462304 [Westerdykella ornata]